jgi:hypothetical protein
MGAGAALETSGLAAALFPQMFPASSVVAPCQSGDARRRPSIEPSDAGRRLEESELR